MKETISIIVPVHNAEKYIQETIASVLEQTYEEWELILIDDCSTDNSVEVMEKIKEDNSEKIIQIIKQPTNQGAAKARNKGVATSTGRYIAFLDADDIWNKNKLEKQVQFMEKKQAAFSFTGYEFADEDGVGMGKIVRVPETLNYKQALQNTTIFTTTVMFDTLKIEKQKIEMPIIKSEDTALWWKILREGHIAYGLDENYALYRRAGKTLSSNKLEALRRIWNLYRKAEKLSIAYSIYNFFFWAVRAVKRRV